MGVVLILSPRILKVQQGNGLIIKTAGLLHEWSGGTTNRHKDGLELIVKPKPILSYP